MYKERDVIMENKMSKMKFILADIILINLAYILAFYIRFDTMISRQFLAYIPKYLENAIYITLMKVAIFYYFDMYKTMWKYASITELLNIVAAVVLSNTVVISFLFARQENFPRSIYVIATLLDLALIGGLRFSFRTFKIDELFNKFDSVEKEDYDYRGRRCCSLSY